MSSLANTYHEEWAGALASRLAEHMEKLAERLAGRVEQAGTRNFTAGFGLAARGSMEIADWRKKIDELDEQIVGLLCERAAAAIAIGQLKQQNSAPIYEPQREQAVYEHIRQKAAKVQPQSLSGAQIQDIYERVMDVMRSLQRPVSGPHS